VEVPAEAADFNSIYEEALMNLKTRKPAVPKGLTSVVSAAEKEQGAKDYYASVRTNVRVSTVFASSCRD
jgi:chitin synthase